MARALSSHALSVGPTIRIEECDDMTEGVRACSHTEEAPGTEKQHPFEGLDCCQQVLHMKFKSALNYNPTKDFTDQMYLSIRGQGYTTM